MQPAPLTGTATVGVDVYLVHQYGCSPHPSRGQQLAPGVYLLFLRRMMQPAPLTGTATAGRAPALQAGGRCSPHPSRGQQQEVRRQVVHLLKMQPAPLTGTATFYICLYSIARDDAARTPHGDSNFEMNGCDKVCLEDAARTPHGDSNMWRP